MKQQNKSIAVLDANAFISMTNIPLLATKARLFTSQDVLDELKDKKTKDYVEKLPYQIQIIASDADTYQIVKDFAIKTGDIATLSQVDMELIAIAYKLYKQYGLSEQLRKEPAAILERNDLEDLFDKDELSSDQEQIKEDQEETQVQGHQSISQEGKELEKLNHNQPKEQQDEGWISVPEKPKRKQSSSSSESDDQGGWITTKNYQKKMAQLSSSFKEELPEEQPVFTISIVSADFALQNVATQIGIKLLSLDGRKITSIRRFIFECYLCWKKYRITDEKVRLCKGCGYNALSKVAYSIDQKGLLILHRKKGWKPNKKILEVKQRKFQEQEKRKKHQHARRTKNASIFQN